MFYKSFYNIKIAYAIREEYVCQSAAIYLIVYELGNLKLENQIRLFP